MTEPCAPINEGIYKKKKPLTFREALEPVLSQNIT